jgi:hypothetical protein
MQFVCTKGQRLFYKSLVFHYNIPNKMLKRVAIISVTGLMLLNSIASKVAPVKKHSTLVQMHGQLHILPILPTGKWP